MDNELKRKKARITPQDKGDEEQDRISRLSDNLIHIIMSFLDIQLAVQTCVLSKRWKFVWTSLPFLKFRSYYCNSPKYIASIPQTTPKFVEEFLKHRNHGSHISSLKLMLLTPALFTKFVKYAIPRHVQYLHGHLKSGLYKLSAFNSNSIRTLKLKMKFHGIVLESNCWSLPNLTTLHLTRVHYDSTHNLPGLCLTCLPVLKTLCLTNWRLEESFFSLSLPGLTTLRLSNCNLPKVDWNFPALKCLVLHDVVFPRNMRDMFAALVSLQNLTLFFYKTSTQDCVLSCPRLVNLEITTRYHHNNGIHIGCINVSAPKLRNFTSGGIFSIRFENPKLDNVYIKLRGWSDHMILPREKLKEYYKRLRFMLSECGTAKNLHLELETIEALSLIADDVVRSPFRNLKYVKLPLGCEERNICSSLRSYLLGGSPTASMVTARPQNMVPDSASADRTAQNVAIQEPLAAPTKVCFNSENLPKTVSIDTVDIWMKEQDIVENYEVQAHRVRHSVAPVEGTCSDRASTSKENSYFGIWRGHEVNSEFVCLLDLIMNKYPETFQHYTTKIKKFCTMELNMLCTSINDFTKMSMAKVETEVISEFRAVFSELQKYGFCVSWLESRLNYVEQLRFAHPLIPELHAIDCHIDDTKSKLQDLQTKLQDLKTVRAEKMQEIRNAFGTLGANLAVGYIGDDLFCV